MNYLGARFPAELVIAADLVKATVSTVAERVCQTLTAQSQSISKAIDRNTMFAAQLALQRQFNAFRMQFQIALEARMQDTLTPFSEAKRKAAPTTWEALTLVDDKEVDDRMLADRLGQQIAQSCEVELCELSGYMGRITGVGSADNERNPLRPNSVGHALHTAIGTVTTDPNERSVLTREFATLMAHAMPTCYAAIVVELQSRGVSPVNLQVRTVDGPGTQLTGLNSGYQSLRDEHPSGHHTHSAHPESAHSSLTSRHSVSGAHHTGHGQGTRDTGAPAQDAHLMTLLRRLTSLTVESGSGGAWSSIAGGSRDLPGSRANVGGLPPPGNNPYANPSVASAYAEDLSAGLMAVNLIRAHRDELIHVSTGKLDHLVIDVVGTLFDQILSDTRVPPQMARQIARLQLPVLRVALADPTFFSSRKHPVRRFVNRMASLACAYDDFEDGPGQAFLSQVRDLVQEIVDGDFDQVELYATKLSELETFVTQQAEAVVQEQGAAAVLETKESDLRIQQRYLVQLQTALASVAMPEFLRNFLCQVWSQAIVQTIRNDGGSSETTRRYREIGRDLVMSVQPQGSPAMRKRFLMQLPALMRDVNSGLKLIGWPESATKEFMAQLMPAHATSLKTPAMTELDYNLLAKQMESVFNAAVPSRSDSVRFDGVAASAAMPADVEQRFSEEEAKQVGLIDERAVDWDRPVDIDLSADAPAAPSEPLSLGIDINLDLITADPAEASHGARLMDNMRIGFAYQMLLKDQWQKVRLTYMSPGRSFFVFTHGRNLQETISLTARMLARMCEAERLRAVENNYLLERATSRARQQLAALSTNTRT